MAATTQHSPVTRLVGIGFVVLLHVVVVYALVTGLAHRAVEVIRAPIVTEIITPEKPQRPEPPPPPVQLAPPPPAFVPPPEVHIEKPPPPPPKSSAITAVTPVVPVAPPPPPIKRRCRRRLKNSLPPFQQRQYPSKKFF